MKNLTSIQLFGLLKTWFIAVVCCFLISCNNKVDEIMVRELDPKNMVDASILAAIAETSDAGIPFPDGSKALENADGGVTIKLPESYKYVIVNEASSGKLSTDEEPIGEIGEVSVTCTCNKGSGGCSPVKAKGEYYCVMNGKCSNCSKSTSSKGKSVTILGIYNTDAAISFIAKGPVSNTDGLKAALYTEPNALQKNVFPALLKLSPVKKSLLDLYNIIYDNNIPDFIVNNAETLPAGYRYVKVNIYGYEAAIPLPNAYVDDNMQPLSAEEPIGEMGKVSCTCNKGKGCKLDSIMGVKFCDAGDCTSCTLSES